MDAKDPNSFSQKYDIDLTLFLKKLTTYFHLSEKIKLNMWVTFFEKGILEMKVFRPKPIHP